MSLFNSMISKFRSIFDHKSKLRDQEQEMVKRNGLEVTPKVTVFLSPCATHQTPSRKRRSKSLMDYSSLKHDLSGFKNISNLSAQLEHFLEDGLEHSKMCTDSTFVKEKDLQEQPSIVDHSFDDHLTIEYLKRKVFKYIDLIKELKFDLMICQEIIKNERKDLQQDTRNDDANNNSQTIAAQEDLKREIKVLREKNAEMNKKIEELQIGEEISNKTLELLQEEFKNYKKEVETTSKSTIDFLSNNIQLNEILQGTLKNSGTMFEKLSTLIGVLDVDTEDVNFILSQKKIDQFKGFFKAINDLTSEVELTKNALTAAIESETKRIEQCRGLVKKIEISHQKISQLEEENNQLQQKLNQSNSFISTLRINCREYSAELRQKNKVIVESKKQISDLINEKRLVQRKCNEVDIENSTHKIKLFKLEEDIKSRDDEIAGQLKILRRLEVTENQVKQMEKLNEVERDYNKKLKEYVQILHDKLMKERKKVQENAVEWGKEKESLNSELKAMQEKLDHNTTIVEESVDRIVSKMRISYDYDMTKMRKRYEERVQTFQRELRNVIFTKEFTERLKKENQQLRGENLELKRKIEALSKKRMDFPSSTQSPRVLLTKPALQTFNLK